MKEIIKYWFWNWCYKVSGKLEKWSKLQINKLEILIVALDKMAELEIEK